MEGALAGYHLRRGYKSLEKGVDIQLDASPAAIPLRIIAAGELARYIAPSETPLLAVNDQPLAVTIRVGP